MGGGRRGRDVGGKGVLLILFLQQFPITSSLLAELAQTFCALSTE